MVNFVKVYSDLRMVGYFCYLVFDPYIKVCFVGLKQLMSSICLRYSMSIVIVILSVVVEG